jgi:hypothetical protein
LTKSFFNINLNFLVGTFIKTKTIKQYYSKKQKLQPKKLNNLKEIFENFYKNNIEQIKENIKNRKVKFQSHFNNILDDIRSKLLDMSFLNFYSEKTITNHQIKELLTNKFQTFLYTNEPDLEIFFTDIQYFTKFYKQKYFNLDFLSLANHYLKFYGKAEIKNVITQFESFTSKNDLYILSTKNAKFNHLKLSNHGLNQNNLCIFDEKYVENSKVNSLKSVKNNKNKSDDFKNNEIYFSRFIESCENKILGNSNFISNFSENFNIFNSPFNISNFTSNLK